MRHECPICGSLFDDFSALSEHVVKAHKSEITKSKIKTKNLTEENLQRLQELAEKEKEAKILREYPLANTKKRGAIIKPVYQETGPRQAHPTKIKERFRFSLESLKLKLFKPNIEKFKEKRDVNRLIKLLTYNDVELCKRAASALNEIGDEACVEPFISLLSDGDIELRRIAFSGIEKHIDDFREKRDVNRLIKLLTYNDVELLMRAVSALGEIGGEECVELFIQLLSHRDVELRKKVVFSLENIATRVEEENLIGVVRRIKRQVIDGESNMCFYCGKIVNSTIGRRCSICNLIVCIDHILPESHGCRGKYIPPVGIAYCHNGKTRAQNGGGCYSKKSQDY